jgi:hypothetical protein
MVDYELTDEDKKEGFTWQDWVYIGQRIHGSSENKPYLVDYFLDEDERERMYKHTRGTNYVIGAKYKIAASDSVAKLGTAKWVTKDHDEPRLPTWVAEDRAAQAHMQRGAAERSAKATESDGLKNMTLNQARSFINSGPYNTRMARLAIVLNAIGV